jgi:hypothetical protein
LPAEGWEDHEAAEAAFGAFEIAVKDAGFKTDNDLFRTQMELATRERLASTAKRVLSVERASVDDAMDTDVNNGDGSDAAMMAECSTIVDFAIKG